MYREIEDACQNHDDGSCNTASRYRSSVKRSLISEPEEYPQMRERTWRDHNFVPFRSDS